MNGTSVQATRVPQTATGGARFWMTHAGHGLALGAVVATLEFAYYYPLVSERNGIGIDSLASLLLVWCGEFALFALAVGVGEYLAGADRELRAGELALAIAVGALAGALMGHAITHLLLRDQFGVRLFVDQVGQAVSWQGKVLYHCWLILFFGGLAAAVRASRQRRARMLAALRAAELDRAKSQRRLAEATLGSLQARIDPEFLFQTLARIEQLYEADPPGADRLLEELTVFLRAALADIRASGEAAGADRMPAFDGVLQVR